MTTKKIIASKVPPLPSLKNDESDQCSVVNETAEVMVQLSKRTPSNDNKMSGSLPKKNGCAALPSPLEIPSNAGVGNEANMMARNSVYAASEYNSTFGSSWNINANPKSPSGTEDMLMLRVRELERQLAEEKYLQRIRELEAERSQRNARERLYESVFDIVMSQHRAAAVIPTLPNRQFAGDGLQSLFPASAINPFVQASERAPTFSRIVEPHHMAMPFERPSSAVSQNVFQNSLEGRPNKKQRLDSLFDVRKG